MLPLVLIRMFISCEALQTFSDRFDAFMQTKSINFPDVILNDCELTTLSGAALLADPLIDHSAL